MSAKYNGRLTDDQLRVINDVLSMVINDPDWGRQFSGRDWAMLQRGHEAIMAGWRAAAASESTPPGEGRKRK